MPQYTLNRNYVLRSVLGHSVSFSKNIPTFVPSIIEREALSIGAERVDGARPDMLDPEPPAQRPPMTPDDVRQQIKTAFALIVERNDPKEFTAAGVPMVKAVEKLIGFDVDRSDVIEAWAEYKAGA